MAKDILEKICNQTRIDLEERKSRVSIDELKEKLQSASPVRGFLNALKNKQQQNKIALIAEVKKASPSKGLIREDFDPASIAKAYESGGAACLSVLTDEPFFQGKMPYLIEARNACTLPVLRKDFMLDPYQVYEARSIGADCILLIVAALNDKSMNELYDLSKSLGMDVLIEVHNKEELLRAKALKPDLLGVNNRNLKTLDVDLQTSHDLAEMMRNIDCTLVSESGIYTPDDIASLKNSGFQTFLIGESLMRQDDVEVATKTLLNL